MSIHFNVGLLGRVLSSVLIACVGPICLGYGLTHLITSFAEKCFATLRYLWQSEQPVATALNGRVTPLNKESSLSKASMPQARVEQSLTNVTKTEETLTVTTTTMTSVSKIGSTLLEKSTELPSEASQQENVTPVVNTFRDRSPEVSSQDSDEDEVEAETSDVESDVEEEFHETGSETDVTFEITEGLKTSTPNQSTLVVSCSQNGGSRSHELGPDAENNLCSTELVADGNQVEAVVLPAEGLEMIFDISERSLRRMRRNYQLLKPHVQKIGDRYVNQIGVLVCNPYVLQMVVTCGMIYLSTLARSPDSSSKQCQCPL